MTRSWPSSAPVPPVKPWPSYRLRKRKQVPLISCSAGSKITDPVRSGSSRPPQNDALAVGKIFEYLQKHKQQKIAILTVSDGFGSSGREQLQGAGAKYGITLVSDDTYGPKDTDMTAQLTKIRGSQAQALIVWAQPRNRP